MLNSFDPEIGGAQRRINVGNEEAHLEEEQNFQKVFYNIVGKVDHLLVEYEKAFGHEKKGINDNRSANHEGGGEEPPLSPPSSYSPHHSNRDSKHTSKKPFFKLDVNFDLQSVVQKNLIIG